MSARPQTIAECIEAAPPEGRPHLRQLYAMLKSVAPEAQTAIKWGTPFFVEPRFLFSFSAHKAHCNFAPRPEVLEHFREEPAGHRTTRNLLQMPYDAPLPEDLVRRIAEYRLQNMGDGDGARLHGTPRSLNPAVPPPPRVGARAESVHRALMRAHVAAGERASALRQFHACRAVLWRRLGFEPDEETRELYRQILDGSG